MNSPWGAIQTMREIAPGIIRVTTASHGGYHLSPERMLSMPVQETPYSRDGWFEEDCDWAWVAVTFPDAFHPQEVAAAKNTITRFYFDLAHLARDV